MVHDIEGDAAAVRAAPAAKRDEAIETFLARYESLWTSIARKYSRSYGIKHKDLDDAAQIVRLEAYKLLLDGAPPNIRWGQALWRRCEEAIREMSMSGANTGFAGMTGHERRRRGLEKLREESGLSGEALLAAWNARAAQSRADPKRQGAIATKEDLVDHRIVLNGAVTSVAEPHYNDPALKYLLDLNFTEELTATVRKTCAREPQIVGQVAQAWLEGAMDGDPMSCAEIARRIGVSRATVQRTMPRVRVLVREVVANYLLEQG